MLLTMLGLLASDGQLGRCCPADSWESNSLGSRGRRLAVANLYVITIQALWVVRKPRFAGTSGVTIRTTAETTQEHLCPV